MEVFNSDVEKILQFLLLEMSGKMRWLLSVAVQRKESRSRKGLLPLVDLSAVGGHAVRHWGPEVEGEHRDSGNAATSVLG